MQRQERLDYEAAEAAYRVFNAELNRVLQAGGSKSATSKMKATAAGPYLEVFTSLVKGFEKNDATQKGERRIGSLIRAGYSRSELLLQTCEDSTKAILYRDGRRAGVGDIREGTITVRRVDSAWKLWSGEARKVEQC